MEMYMYKTNNFFHSNDCLALGIILYQDTFEICNPLGSARGKYKIIRIYMTLANLFPWKRCQIDQIQLVGLCFEHHVKNFGFDTILESLINDLKMLETCGLMINETFHNKATLVACLGDNLGSHQIGGYLENFSTDNYFCRYCYMQSDNFVDYKHKTNFRTKNSYNADVEMALIMNSHYCGVKKDSPLNKWQYFHVTSGLPPCFAHDILEGIAPYDIMLSINDLVCKKIISLELLNTAFKNIKFIESFSNCNIAYLKKSDKIIGSASEMLYIL